VLPRIPNDNYPDKPTSKSTNGSHKSNGFAFLSIVVIVAVVVVLLLLGGF
jgi:hypothetical protein